MTNTDKTKLIDFLISYKINDPISIRIYKRKQNELIDITSIVNITEKIEINMNTVLLIIPPKLTIRRMEFITSRNECI